MLGLGSTLVKGVGENGFGKPLSSNAYSIDFDGANDYISISDQSIFSFGDASTDLPFSCSAWIKMDDQAKFRIMAKSGAGTGNIEWFFGTGASDLLSLYLYDNEGGQQIARHSTDLLGEDSWIHVAATYSGGGNNTDINMYVNGVNDNDSVSSAGSYTAMHSGGGALTIGSFARTGTTDYANGTIDEVSLWDRELTAGEVKAIYNSGLPTDLSSENGLIGYWRMDEGTGTSVADSSTNSNAGTLVNSPTWTVDTPDD